MLNDFKMYLRSKGRSENTVIAYGRDVSEFLKFLKSTGVRVQDVDHGALLKFLANLTEKKLSSSTRRRMMEAIKVFYRAMQKMGKLEEDPFQGFEDMPKVEDSNRRVLTEMEYRSLRDVVRGCRRKTSVRDFAILELSLQTGLRRAEICSLIADDVQFSTRTTAGRVRVRKGKGGKERTVTLNDAAERALKEYMAMRPEDTGYKEIFLNNQRRPCNPVIISRIFKKHMESAGIHDASFHSLRHTFATHSLRKGTNIRVVQEALGHKNLATTQKYLHFLQEMMDDQLTKNAL